MWEMYHKAKGLQITKCRSVVHRISKPCAIGFFFLLAACQW